MRYYHLLMLLAFQGDPVSIPVPLNTPIVFRAQSPSTLSSSAVLWSAPDLDGLSLTATKATVLIFYDSTNTPKLIIRSDSPIPPTPDPNPVPVPPPSPVPSGQFNIAPFVYSLSRSLDRTQRAEFQSNFSSIAASIDALPAKTKGVAEAELIARNRASLSRYPTWAFSLDQILAEANKHKAEIKTSSDLSTLYKEIALGLQ